MKRIITLSTSALLLGSLAACNESGGNGAINLAITDAPVDDASEVVVNITGATLHTSGNDNLEFVFCDGQPTAIDTACDTPASKDINLMALTGNISELLIDTTTIPAGNYQWIRLELDETNPGHIVTSTGTHNLTIPSGDQAGLRLNSGFKVEEGETASFTIDFDLRKSVHLANNGQNYILRPTLRIVDNNKAGTIEGTVGSALVVSGNGCENNNYGAVYLYEGANATPGQIGSANEPLTTATVEYINPTYQYQIGFVEAGSYTLAFTCDSINDTDDANDTVNFHAITHDVTVAAGNGSTTTVDLQ